MQPTKELISQLDDEDIEQAKSMTPWQRFRAGGDLFDDACRWTLAGILNDHPGITDADAFEILKERVAMIE